MIKILKQTSWLLIAQVVTKIIGFFYTIYLARTLGVGDFGLFSTALAYFSIIAAVIDFGFSRYLLLAIAVDRKKATELVGSLGLLRLALTSVLFIIFALALYLLDPDQVRVHLILLAVLAILPLSCAQTLDTVFVGLKKLELSGITLIILSLSTSVLGVYLTSRGMGVLGAVIALPIGHIVYLIAQFFILQQEKISFAIPFNRIDVKKIIYETMPYGFLSVLGLLYFRVDTIIITYLKTSFEVGIYTAAYKFLDAITFVPAAFSAAFFPVTAELMQNNPQQAYTIYRKGLVILLLMSLIVVVSYIFLVPPVIYLLIPRYTQSVEVIKILSLTIPFMFMISLQGVVLFMDKNFLKPLVYMSLFNLGLNILMNFLFIPKIGIMGAAWSTVISDIIGFSIFFIFIKLKFNKVK